MRAKPFAWNDETSLAKHFAQATTSGVHGIATRSLFANDRIPDLRRTGWNQRILAPAESVDAPWHRDSRTVIVRRFIAPRMSDEEEMCLRRQLVSRPSFATTELDNRSIAFFERQRIVGAKSRDRNGFSSRRAPLTSAR